VLLFKHLIRHLRMIATEPDEGHVARATNSGEIVLKALVILVNVFRVLELLRFLDFDFLLGLGEEFELGNTLTSFSASMVVSCC
jgi:hypothetical protein